MGEKIFHKIPDNLLDIEIEHLWFQRYIWPTRNTQGLKKKPYAQTFDSKV